MLEDGQLWIRNVLQELSAGKRVHLWWWERTGPEELTLFLLAGHENDPWSVAIAESAVRGCADDYKTRQEVRQRLAALLKSISADASEADGDSSID